MSVKEEPTPIQTTAPLIGSKAWLGTIHDDAGDWHGDDDDRDWDEEDGDYEDCGLMHDGQCFKAGSEECDFECPNRNSELFVGSAAWRRKHGVQDAE